MKKLSTLFRYLLVCTAVSAVLFSCKKKDSDTPAPPADNPNKYVNDWIYSNMKDVYYWTDNIPANPDYTLTPDLFFKSLLKQPDDRFSWIQDNFLDLLNSLSGVNKEAGYEYVLFLHSNGTKIGGQIQYVKKGSPAAAAGLQRGDMFFQVNGQDINYSQATSRTDINTLLQKLGANHTLTIAPYIKTAAGKDSVGDSRQVNLTVVELADNPVYFDSVYAMEGRKIGYFIYNFFSPDKGDSSFTYDNQMDAVFGRFRAAGVTDLVLDLRYNSGGDQRSTVNLGSQIVKGWSADKLFFKRQFNTLVTQELTKAYGADYFNIKFTNKSNNVGNNLQNFIILTSSHTASASELIINGLKPYMTVWLIGETTAGKNYGSWSIYEKNDPKNKWGMQPLVTKTFNSLNQSDYSSGFTPNETYSETFDLGKLGDSKEPMLFRALTKILGHAPARMALPENAALRTRVDAIGSSRDFKAYSNTLVERKPVY